jgi:hypothetical protein
MTSTKSDLTKKPSFDFDIPKGYEWLLERALIGFEPFSPLQPWHYLDAENVFNVTTKWPQGPFKEGELIAFAKRQDCDDVACFCVKTGKVEGLVIIHGWTNQGYEVLVRFETFWDWLKSIIDDISEWVEQ